MIFAEKVEDTDKRKQQNCDYPKPIPRDKLFIKLFQILSVSI